MAVNFRMNILTFIDLIRRICQCQCGERADSKSSDLHIVDQRVWRRAGVLGGRQRVCVKVLLLERSNA